MVFVRAFHDCAGEVGAGIDEALVRALERARATWPDVSVDEARFAEHLAASVKGAPDLAASLDDLEASDLYLAFACATGDAAALATLDRVYVAQLRGPLAKIGLDRSSIDDTLQAMHEELLAGNEPKMLGYAGRGPLRSWLRAVAARTGLRMIKKTPRHDELDERTHTPIADDLELAYMKKTYGDVFKQAFRDALDGLAAADLLLLKQRFRHRMSVEELGALHGVHSSTISRRVETARERLVTMTRAAMMRELEVGRADVSSILRLIESEVDITLSSLG